FGNGAKQIKELSVSLNYKLVDADNLFVAVLAMPNLERLSLIGNKISAIPDATIPIVLKKLTSLNLYVNKITKIGTYLSHFPNLNNIGMLGNEISKINKDTFKLSAKSEKPLKLDLLFNILTADDFEVGSFDHLRR